MPTTPCESEIPELTAPWSDLTTSIRCCWTSAHAQLEIRAVVISGAEVWFAREPEAQATEKEPGAGGEQPSQQEATGDTLNEEDRPTAPYPPQEHVILENGGAFQIHEGFVPYGTKVSWSIIVFVGDVTGTAMEGISAVVEFKDGKGHGVRRSLCSEAKAAANQAVALTGEIDTPERDHE